MGGEDFDLNMMNFFVDDFKKKYRKNLKDSQKSMAKLKKECERAKRALSTSSQAYIEIDCLIDNIDYNTTISRAKFEQINSSLFKKCLDCVEKVLKDSKVSKSSIDDIVLVGGTTRIPKMQQLLKDYFGNKELCNSINPDEAVAYLSLIHI